MSKIYKVESKHAPPAVGPYSQATMDENYMYVSGQLPFKPGTKELIDGDIKEATTQVIRYITNILTTQGLDLTDVMRTEIFLRDIDNDFTGMNEVYENMFKQEVQPARQAIQPAKLPLGAIIEMSCIAKLRK